VTAPVLDVQGLTVRLPRGADRANAVENVSFAVAPGEILCVVGESGSGKSVTAHAIMGLLPPNQLTVAAGRVLLEGDNLLAKTPTQMRRIRGDRISMIFQEPMTALNPVMKVGDQITEVLDIHSSLSDADRRA
jgi:peptide/nickel transport system ATP-binding protein